jgi:hypothetical protein
VSRDFWIQIFRASSSPEHQTIPVALIFFLIAKIFAIQIAQMVPFTAGIIANGGKFSAKQ